MIPFLIQTGPVNSSHLVYLRTNLNYSVFYAYVFQVVSSFQSVQKTAYKIFVRPIPADGCKLHCLLFKRNQLKEPFFTQIFER